MSQNQQPPGISPSAADTHPKAPAESPTTRSQTPSQEVLADNGPPKDAKTDGEGNGKPQETGEFKYYMRIFKYTDSASWGLNAIAFVAMVGSGTTLPLMDIVFGKFVTVFNQFAVGQMSPEGYRAEVYHYTLYFIYLFVAKFVLTYIWTFLLATTAMRTTKAIRIDFLRQTLRQEIAFFDTPSASSISGQVTTNGNLINIGISEKLGLVIQAFAMFIAAFIIAFVVQWKLTLIIVGIVPVNLIVTTICVIFDTMYEYKMLGIFANAAALAEEIFASIKNVHAFWAFPRLSTKFEAILEEARVVGMKKSPVYVVLFSIEFFLIYCGYALAFWRGIRMYASGEIADPGIIVTVIFAVVVAAQALTIIAPQTIQITKAAAAAQELFQTIDRKSAIDSLSEEGIVPDECRGDIRLSSVGFAYPTRPNVPVLENLDVSIPANKTTALVGASGSGKSTIVGLVERWYNPASGSITLDGTPIQDLNIRWLRTNIRLVQQEPTLFNGTIFQNVAYGLTGTPQADLPEDEKVKLVEEACKAAFAHDFVTELPEGYHTRIGERGASLSGGQKQRIVIARSIISNPRVLLLDEATSALDPKAEKIVQLALNNVAVGRTMLVIAHRLSTIRDADNIIVMSQGRAIEQGTHDELMSHDGAYARLVRTQDLGRQSDKSDSDDELENAAAHGDAVTQKMSAVSTRAERQSTTAGDGVDDKSKDVSLLKGLYLIGMEQRSLWIWFVWLVIGSVAGGATYPAVAILFAEVMKAFELQGDAMTNRGDFFSIMFFVVALGQIATYALLGIVGNQLAQVMLKAYRLEIFDNTTRQEMSFFDEPSNTAGALVSRLSSDPTNVQELLSMNIALILINVVNVISSSILAIVVGWKLGLVLVFGALPPLVFSGYLRIRLEFALDNDTASRFASSSGLAAEAVRSIRTVSSLALEREVIDRYMDALKGLSQRSAKSLVWRMFWYALSQSISFLAMGLGFWYGGQLISTGEYTPSQFYIVFIAVIFSGEACALFFQYTTSITKATVSINYIFKLRRLLQRSEDSQYDGSDDPEKVDGDSGVLCEDLEFAYPQRPNLRILRGVNTEIKSGQFAAFVGASGCGKTTMISLIERFYEPTSGTIKFGGRPIAAFDRKDFRRQVALVQQEPVLYQGSIRENIALGVEEREPTEEEVMDACRQANIHDFVISLPDGLGTACGSQGLQLSGGQRQRIAIARALIRKPKLLLLDEATSALDTESEKVVKAALDSAAQGRTTISVAHRLSTIRDADVIFVFSHGKIVETGKHDQLLQKKGIYYEMCLGQTLDRSV